MAPSRGVARVPEQEAANRHVANKAVKYTVRCIAYLFYINNIIVLSQYKWLIYAFYA